ncbi:MAG: hypothetical protein U0325_28870 [Polyangiales bacterium]
MSPSPRACLAALCLAACSNHAPARASLGASVRPAPVAAPAALTDPACRADVECAPIACCGPADADGCVARAQAARDCEAVECPAPRGPTLRCACRAGRCVGVR